MVQSLLRRSNPPTEITYEESKSVLHAMGVPCIESTGPYEAEALASSLVLNGCADYVASEDTVCGGTQILTFYLIFRSPSLSP
jgi:flap endonuclease-1